MTLPSTPVAVVTLPSAGVVVVSLGSASSLYVGDFFIFCSGCQCNLFKLLLIGMPAVACPAPVLLATPHRAVHSIAPTLPLLRIIGGPGSGAVIGQPPQFSGPQGLAAAPWSNTTVLVADSGNGRVVEVDVLNSTLVRVWATGFNGVRGVAASPDTIAVSQENTTSARVLLYSVQGGGMLVTIGSAPLAAGNTCCAGTQLGQPSGLTFSQDGTYIEVAEAASNRVTRWRVVDGVYLATVGSAYTRPLDVRQCYSTASGSIGVTVASYNGSRLDVVVDGVQSPFSLGAVGGSVAPGSPAGHALVPGLGVVAATQSPSSLVLLSSVVITGQPGNTSVVAGSSATFTVATSGAPTGLTYGWMRNGSAVGGNSSSYVLITALSSVAQVYSVVCTVTHALGQAVSNLAYLNVYVQVGALRQGCCS